MEKYAPMEENKKYKKIKYNYKGNSINNNLDLVGLKDNKLIELENDKQFLLEKNNEIEKQIKKLQNIAKKVNYIHQKNNYYNYNNYNNSQEEIPKMHYASFNYDGNYNFNYSLENPNNSLKYSNYSNITQDRNNNYIQIEDDSLEFFLDKNKNEKSNIQLYEDINNYYNGKSSKNNSINNNIKRNVSFSSRNIRQNNNNRISNYLNYIKKNQTFQRKKKSHESLRMNLRYNKFKEKKNSFGKKENKKSDINVKFELIKNFINELNNKDINKNIKNFLVDKINELQNDANNKISALEKKYNVDINQKLRKINKLKIENADLKKKVKKIKSIV